MDNVKVYAMQTTSRSLRRAVRGDVDKSLSRPLDTMAADIVKRALKTPILIYLCSEDSEREVRNLFAVLLASMIRERIPSTLVVDCDFLEPGLSTLVPDSDAQGLLDLILYGSSLTVITQQAHNGVSLIGAGSFPVSKRMPFLMDAFEDSARYLGSASDCVIFCGPLLDDNEEVHPIAGTAELPLVIGKGSAADVGPLASTEAKLASAATRQVWSVRVRESDVTPVTIAAEDEEGVKELTVGVDEILEKREAERVAARHPAVRRDAEEDDNLDAEVAGVVDVPFDEEGPVETLGGRSWNSAVPKIVTSALAVFLVGFLVWFLYLTRALREEGEPPAIDVTEVMREDRGEQATVGGDSVTMPGTGSPEDLAATDEDLASATRADTAGAATGLHRRPNGDKPERVVDGQTKSQDTSAVDERVTTPPKPLEETVTSTPPPDTTPPRTTPSPSVPADLVGYAGKYLVHVSSFRGTTRAQSDADYLKERGFATVIAQFDLGEKGIWYRVYVGPFDSRDDALTVKIRLDENPRVLSTRITRVPIQRVQDGES